MRENAPDYVAATRPEARPGPGAVAGLFGYGSGLCRIGHQGREVVRGLQRGPGGDGGRSRGGRDRQTGGRKIENIYDYTYAIEALKIGEAVEMVVQRGGQEVTLQVTPGSRD